jgi:hypothetical protein
MRVPSLAPNKIEKLRDVFFFFVKREKKRFQKKREKQFVEPRERFSLAPSALLNAKMNLNRAKRERDRERT